MDTTDGLVRGMDVRDTGNPIMMPIVLSASAASSTSSASPSTTAAVHAKKFAPIHRAPPSFQEQSTKIEVFETGIKVVDLLAPYRKGGKIGLFGGAGVGKTVLIMELVKQTSRKSTAASAALPASASARGKETISISSSKKPSSAPANAVLSQSRAHLRADERAARRAPACRALGAHRRRILPR